jgi:uncharacterized protein YfiM (DUF2279 family)
MKKLIAVIVAGIVLSLPLSASASAIEKDKAEHFGAGMAIDTAEAVIFPKWTPFERFLGVAAIAGAKEWYDSRHSDRHSAEWKDFAATCLGGLTGEGCIWIVHKTW